jgi:hypothetical protein
VLSQASSSPQSGVERDRKCDWRIPRWGRVGGGRGAIVQIRYSNGEDGGLSWEKHFFASAAFPFRKPSFVRGMSQTTTTTTTMSHVLVKYSKSHPTSVDQALRPNNEWQHFVNPVLRLTLDVKKSSLKGELESVRLRISWSMNAGTDYMDVDQREVVFVSLILLNKNSLWT